MRHLMGREDTNERCGLPCLMMIENKWSGTTRVYQEARKICYVSVAVEATTAMSKNSKLYRLFIKW